MAQTQGLKQAEIWRINVILLEGGQEGGGQWGRGEDGARRGGISQMDMMECLKGLSQLAHN